MNTRRYSHYVWGVLAYNLLVILWGAFVRATGSGAGCGARWPTCNGQVIPRAPALETLIEFFHRASSGILVLLVVGLIIGAFRLFPKGHPVRLGVVLSGVFLLGEVLLGAGLVWFGLTGTNDSMARAIVIAIHLVNTLLLTGALTLTAWWASGGAPLHPREQGSIAWFLLLGLLGVMVVAMAGAITALGDTLFPARSLSQGIAQDLSPTVHFLIRLRVVHPLLAVGVSLYAIVLAGVVSMARPSAVVRRLARSISLLFLLQLGAGLLNVGLLAPVWMQLLHLLLADLLWINLVLLSAAALAIRAEPAVGVPKPV